jgi:AGZA family xanthine/uracil permease-like MFS transporter
MNLESYFQLKKNKTSIKQECVAGVTTFFTMVYIVMVNPQMLAQAGMDYGSVFVATCLAAAIGSILMGLLANYPIAQAPGMGLNAFFTYTIVLEFGYSWQVALAAVFLSGLMFLIVASLPIRDWLIQSMPETLRLSIAAGIGLFLALLALKNAGFIVSNPATLVALGSLQEWSVWMAALSFFIVVALAYRGFHSSVVISLAVVTLASLIHGDVSFHGFFSIPSSIEPTFLAFDLVGVLDLGLITLIFSLLFIDLFDTTGALMAVAERGGFLDKKSNLPRLKQALWADAAATSIGALLGSSTTTSYIESTAGVSVGGRTGLTAVVVGVCFLLCLFFMPLTQLVPIYASSGALLYVAVLMLSCLGRVKWTDLTEAAPAAVVCISMPLTASLANGIGFGFLTYTGLKLLCGKQEELNPNVIFITSLFFIKLIWLF